jgi:hypothetical protein
MYIGHFSSSAGFSKCSYELLMVILGEGCVTSYHTGDLNILFKFIGDKVPFKLLVLSLVCNAFSS